MTVPSRAAAATWGRAQEIAEARLKDSASAVEAMLAGYFALACSTSWGLFAGVTFVVGGGGARLCFVDGRPRQAGRAGSRVKRREGPEDAPLAARAAVPGSVAAAAAVSALFGVTLPKVTRAGAEIARDLGVKERVRLVSAIGTLGVRALVDRAFTEALLATVPPNEGHPLSPDDFDAPAVDIVARGVVEGSFVRAPWADDSARALGVGRVVHAVLVVDRRGTLAAAVLESPEAELALADGSASLPVAGEPLRKGIPRLRPGSPLPIAAPVRVRLDGERPLDITLVGATQAVGVVPETGAAWAR